MRAAPERSELQDMIVYFADKIPYLTEIRLVKLFYAAEIYYIEKFTNRLTNIPFIHYHYGVWSPRVMSEGMMMAGTDILTEKEKTLEGHEATFIKIVQGRESVDLPDEVISILNDVIADWQFKSTDELIEFTKSTIPYRRSKFGEVLDLDRYVELMKLVYGDKELIEAVERSRKEAKEGKGRTFVNKEELERYYDAL